MYAIESLMASAMPRLNAARRSLAATRVAAAVAAEPRYALLSTSIQHVVDTHITLVRLEDEWRAQRASAAMHGREAVGVDNQLDRAVSALLSMLEGYTRSLTEREALEMARHLLDWCFPEGAAAITNLPFVEQHAAVLVLLEKLHDEASQAAVERLGLGLAIATIESLNEVYGRLVTQNRPLNPERMAEADLVAREATGSFAAAVVGTFASNEPDDVAARTALLAPFFAQKAELAKLRKRRAGDEDLLDEVEEVLQDLDDADDVGEDEPVHTDADQDIDVAV